MLAILSAFSSVILAAFAAVLVLFFSARPPIVFVPLIFLFPLPRFFPTSPSLSSFSFASVGCKRTQARPSVFDGGGYLDELSTQSDMRPGSGVLCSGCLTKKRTAIGHRNTPKSLPQCVRCESDPVCVSFSQKEMINSKMSNNKYKHTIQSKRRKT